MLRLFDMDIPLTYKCMSAISGNCLSICQEDLDQFLTSEHLSELSENLSKQYIIYLEASTCMWRTHLA
jgi:hypothetical protein